MGRRKIEIKKIDNKAYLKATFSKRRKGLFRKAAELCDMCGAEIAILTVSPGGKFYNFGHPNVDSVISRYCGDDTSCTVEENHDCVSLEDDVKENHDCVSHEDDHDEEDLEGEQEKEVSSTDEEDEPAGEEKELVDDHMMEKDVIGRFKRGRDGRKRIGLNHKFWWDGKEPSDPEQRRMYYRSLAQLRNNVVWVLNDRNRRESYTKDYIGGI